MKLILQIALGVFLGVVSAQICLDFWHDRQNAEKLALQEKQRDEREKARLAQADRIRALILEKQRQKGMESNKLPPSFVPDDAEGSPNNGQE